MKKFMSIVAALGISSAVMAGGYKKDIVETATSAGSFDTLISAIDAADLGDTLKGDGPFTVFAPTDEAFAALPEGTLEQWLQPENKDKLVELLKYHVVPGKVLSGDISDETVSFGNLVGSELAIDTDSGVTVNTAAITEKDIKASNGVIHVIDKVIMPSTWPAS